MRPSKVCRPRKLYRQKRQARLPLGISGALTVLSLGSPARADEAAARALFDDGVRLMNSHAYAEACPKLDAAIALDRGALGGLLQAGRCYEEAGRLATAWARYRDAVDLGTRRGDARAGQAQEAIGRIEPRLAKLRIVVPPPIERDGNAEIRHDGSPIPRPLWVSAFPIDAGKHRFDVEATGFTNWSTELQVHDGETATLTIPELSPTTRTRTDVDAAVVGPTRGAVDAPGAGSSSPTWPIVTLVAGGVTLAGTVAFAVLWASYDAEYAEACQFGTDANGAALCRPVDAAPSDVFDEAGMRQEGERLGTLRSAFAGLTIGTAVVAVGLGIATAVGFATADDNPKVALVPLLGPEQLGLTVQGSF